MSAMKTEELIQRLAADIRPIRRLASPSRRVVAWLAAGLPYLALVVLTMSPRDDLATKLSEIRFLVEQGAAFATADKKTFRVEVTDGLLEIDLVGRVGEPKVSAIKVEWVR